MPIGVFFDLEQIFRPAGACLITGHEALSGGGLTDKGRQHEDDLQGQAGENQVLHGAVEHDQRAHHRRQHQLAPHDGEHLGAEAPSAPRQGPPPLLRPPPAICCRAKLMELAPYVTVPLQATEDLSL